MSGRRRHSRLQPKPLQASAEHDNGLYQWVEWGEQRIWVVDYTPGGAPIGLADDRCEDDRTECERGLDDPEPF